MVKLHRRAALGLGASLLAAPALAQGRFPNRPIRFITPWPPGGSLDALQRNMFEVLRKDLGQPILSENMPGARGHAPQPFWSRKVCQMAIRWRIITFPCCAIPS